MPRTVPGTAQLMWVHMIVPECPSSPDKLLCALFFFSQPAALVAFDALTPKLSESAHLLFMRGRYLLRVERRIIMT